MKSKGISRADENRAIQKDTLRERLEAGGHIQHVLDISNQLGDLDIQLDSTQSSRLKASADIKLRIIDKYLASLKAVEMTGAEGKPLLEGLTVNFVNAS